MAPLRSLFARPRPKVQFSLRTLLVVVLACACAAGWLGYRIERAHRQKAAVAWVETQGGTVYYEDAATQSWPTRVLKRWFPASVTAVDLYNRYYFAADISQVDCRVTELDALSGLGDVEELNLKGTHVEDLAALKRLRHLRRLYLALTPITDLAALAQVESLQRLDLSYTLVEDLAPLAQLRNLRELYLVDTQVRDLAPLSKLKNLRQLPPTLCRPVEGIPDSFRFTHLLLKIRSLH